MCCACNGGTTQYISPNETEAQLIETSVVKYKECLISNNLEDVAKKYDCDIMNTTYDQYKFRAQCWDE